MMADQPESTLSPDDVLVRPQPTPNPAAMKFIVNQPLKREGKATINAPEDAPELKLVEGLFQVQGVKQLHFFQNTVTVTHEGSLSPEELIENVIPVLKTRIPIHN
ncbi:MAG: NifU N-terminal domain-containing protein, partial [Pseudomonadota bacterium]